MELYNKGKKVVVVRVWFLVIDDRHLSTASYRDKKTCQEVGGLVVGDHDGQMEVRYVGYLVSIPICVNNAIFYHNGEDDR